MVKTEFCERDKADLSLAETLQGLIQVKSELMTNSAGTCKNADPAFLLKFSFPKHNDTSEQILFASDNL